MKSRLIICFLALVGLYFISEGPALALAPDKTNAEIRNQMLQEAKDKNASREALIRRVLRSREQAVIAAATLAGKDGATLTVTKEGKTYTVITDGKTKFRRKFWGKGELAEMTVGDSLNLIGKWTNEEKSSLYAILVRDTSLQKRNGVFIGTVESVSGNNLVIQTINRDKQTATVTDATKYLNRKEQKITLSAVKSGHRIRVRGLWNNQNNTITEVKEIKDFSLPEKITPTPQKSP